MEDLNNPGRSEWYLMAIAAEIRRTIVKDPSKVSIADMRLSLMVDTDRNPAAPPLPTNRHPRPAPEHVKAIHTAMAKSKWVGRIGGSEGVIHLEITREEAEKIRKMPIDEAARYKRKLAEERGLVKAPKSKEVKQEPLTNKRGRRRGH